MAPTIRAQTPSSAFLAAPLSVGAAGALPVGLDGWSPPSVPLGFVYGPLYPIAVTPVSFTQGPEGALDERVISAHFNIINMLADAILNCVLLETSKHWRANTHIIKPTTLVPIPTRDNLNSRIHSFLYTQILRYHLQPKHISLHISIALSPSPQIVQNSTHHTPHTKSSHPHLLKNTRNNHIEPHSNIISQSKQNLHVRPVLIHSQLYRSPRYRKRRPFWKEVGVGRVKAATGEGLRLSGL